MNYYLQMPLLFNIKQYRNKQFPSPLISLQYKPNSFNCWSRACCAWAHSSADRSCYKGKEINLSSTNLNNLLNNQVSWKKMVLYNISTTNTFFVLFLRPCWIVIKVGYSVRNYVIIQVKDIIIHTCWNFCLFEADRRFVFLFFFFMVQKAQVGKKDATTFFCSIIKYMYDFRNTILYLEHKFFFYIPLYIWSIGVLNRKMAGGLHKNSVCKNLPID